MEKKSLETTVASMYTQLIAASLTTSRVGGLPKNRPDLTT